MLVSLVAGGCGEDGSGGSATPTPTAGHWRTAVIEGAANICGMAFVSGELLLVPGQGERSLFAVPTTELRADGAVRARPLSIEVRKETRLMGNEPPGDRDYDLGTFWDLEVDFQGLAFQPPEWLFLGDRSHRIVYIARIRRNAAGELARAIVDRAFVARGATRARLDQGDFRDTGPGLASLLTMPRERRSDDLFLIPRGPADGQAGIRVELLDRLGVSMSSFEVRDADAFGADVEAGSWHAGRFVTFRNSKQGVLMTFQEPGMRKRSAPFGRGLPGPPVFEGEVYRGMAHGADGTLYLVTDGSPAHIAWREP